MAVNLVRQVGRAAARKMLESSFAQFQADRAVVGLARQIRRNEEGLAGYREAMTCHLGDFEEYARLRRALSDRESELARAGAANRRAAATASLERLRPGDVIRVPAGRRAGLAVVLDPGASASFDGPRPTVLTADRQVKKLSVADFPVPVEPVDRLRIPKSFNPRSPQARRDLASALRTKAGDHTARHDAGRPRRQRSGAADDDEIARLRAELRAHPAHGCADREDHARWAERYWRLARDTEAMQRRVRTRTHTIARTFDRVCALLQDLGYLRGDEVTGDGQRLTRLYTELDLLTAECLRRRLWEDLTAPELAACVSALVFEARQSDDVAPPRLPGGRAQAALGEMLRLWGELRDLESEHRLSFLREPDLGFAWAAHRWASGHRLETVLVDADLTAGDFVRWTKQLMDLLGQIADAAPEDGRMRKTARQAADSLRRGVVAYSSVSE
jgi:ATP-dependent RNA helicase HelY